MWMSKLNYFSLWSEVQLEKIVSVTQSKARTYVFMRITPSSQALSFLCYICQMKSKLCIWISNTQKHRWCSDSSHQKYQSEDIHCSFQSVCCTFSNLFSSSLAGEKYTHDVLFPPRTIDCVISNGKNCGRLGEGSGGEKMYALMSNSFSKKDMLTLQVSFSSGNI